MVGKLVSLGQGAPGAGGTWPSAMPATGSVSSLPVALTGASRRSATSGSSRRLAVSGSQPRLTINVRPSSSCSGVSTS